MKRPMTKNSTLQTVVNTEIATKKYKRFITLV